MSLGMDCTVEICVSEAVKNSACKNELCRYSKWRLMDLVFR